MHETIVSHEKKLRNLRDWKKKIETTRAYVAVGEENQL
jgi:hypothetical protein